jgi:hypothetical protein
LFAIKINNDKMNYTHKRLLSLLLILLALLMIEAYFFRYMILSKFDGMPGDACDARFQMLICEHWYGVFQGNETIRNLRIFYPQANTLGYSDPLLVYAIPYSILRSIGLDMLRAMQSVLILFHTLGSIGMFLLLNLK